MSALVEYAKPLHLDVLGNQQSFGHFGQILSHPEYAALRETPDVLTPVREETYQFLDDLYSEDVPAADLPVVQRLLRRDGRAGHRAVAGTGGEDRRRAACMSATSAASTICSATNTTSA